MDNIEWRKGNEDGFFFFLFLVCDERFESVSCNLRGKSFPAAPMLSYSPAPIRKRDEKIIKWGLFTVAGCAVPVAQSGLYLTMKCKVLDIPLKIGIDQGTLCRRPLELHQSH